MRRARVLGTVLALVLLACGAVIYLDQRGSFGSATGSAGTVQPNPSTGTAPSTSDDPGYGELK